MQTAWTTDTDCGPRVPYAHMQGGPSHGAVSNSLGRYAVSIPAIARGDRVRVLVPHIEYAGSTIVGVAHADTLDIDAG